MIGVVMAAASYDLTAVNAELLNGAATATSFISANTAPLLAATGAFAAVALGRKWVRRLLRG